MPADKKYLKWCAKQKKGIKLTNQSENLQKAYMKKSQTALQTMQPSAIWITGLSASCKTTIALLLKDYIKSKNFPVIILDGDEIRKTLSKELGFLPEYVKRLASKFIYT
ncbi:MAG: adenylyl-sulfate kinase [Nitrosotalea sp.]